MKKVTIFKTIGVIILGVISSQTLPVGLSLMSKPSSLLFTVGVLLSIVCVAANVFLAVKFVEYLILLVVEHFESKDLK